MTRQCKNQKEKFFPLIYTLFFYVTVGQIFCLLLIACATGNSKKDVSQTPTMPKNISAPVFRPVTFSQHSGHVGEVLRALGEQFGGGFALMSGLEERAISTIEFKNKPYEEVMTQIASSLGCISLKFPYYFLILPAEYEVLKTIDVRTDMHSLYVNNSVEAVFGAKTPLYVIFSILSKNLDMTIVADNYIAETRCGEIRLPEMPLPDMLQAILQSARIAPGSFVVESTEEYIFIRSVHNMSLPSLRIHSEPLEASVQDLLDKRVSVILPPEPEDKGNLLFAAEPLLLREALEPLTQQLGVEIAAQRRLGEIPVNPCVMNHVRLETALNLLIRQWPVAIFGWEVYPDYILIRERETN